MSKTKTSPASKHRVPPYKRPFLVAIILIVLILVVAGIIIVCVNISKKPAESTPTPPATSQSPLGAQDQDVPSSRDEDSPNERPTAFEGEDPNQLESLTGSISFKNVSNGLLSLAVTIDQYLMEPGTCVLTLSRDQAEAHSETVPAVADVTTSACETFRVNTTNLPSGTYQIKIVMTGDGKTGTVTDEVTL